MQKAHGSLTPLDSMKSMPILSQPFSSSAIQIEVNSLSISSEKVTTHLRLRLTNSLCPSITAGLPRRACQLNRWHARWTECKGTNVVTRKYSKSLTS
jgi:hypothetical protein